MLNSKKIFTETVKKNKAENFAHFEKDVFFEENDNFQILVDFDLKGASINATN
jgi:hypothetical protein